MSDQSNPPLTQPNSGNINRNVSVQFQLDQPDANSNSSPLSSFPKMTDQNSTSSTPEDSDQQQQPNSKNWRPGYQTKQFIKSYSNPPAIPMRKSHASIQVVGRKGLLEPSDDAYLKSYADIGQHEDNQDEDDVIPLPPFNLDMPSFVTNEKGNLVPPLLNSMEFFDFDFENDNESETPSSAIIEKDYLRTNSISKLPDNFSMNPSSSSPISSIDKAPKFVEEAIQKPSKLGKAGLPLQISQIYKEQYCAFLQLPYNSKKEDILAKIAPYTILSYAQNNFRKHHPSGFTMKYMPLDQLLDFNEKPLYKMLLKRIPDEKKEIAKVISWTMLKYAGVIHSEDTPENLSLIMAQVVRENPDLIDEVFFQLIKCTRNCPNPQWNRKFWDLWVIMGSFFPVTEEARPYIFGYLLRTIYSWSEPTPPINKSPSYTATDKKAGKGKKKKDQAVAFEQSTPSTGGPTTVPNSIIVIARFTFIRMYERTCVIGRVAEREINRDRISKMPKAAMFSRAMFMCSLYEVMWSQRKTFPALPIPAPLYLTIAQIRQNGGLLSPELFKPACGAIARETVKKWVAELPLNTNVIQHGEVHELMALVHFFLFNLTDSIIPTKMADIFIEKCSNQLYDDVIKQLPPLHRNTFKFIIGFLQEVLQYNAQNQIPLDKIVNEMHKFLVETNTKTIEPFKRGKLIELCPGFLKYCIENLDCKLVYPLDPRYTRQVSQDTRNNRAQTFKETRRESLLPT